MVRYAVYVCDERYGGEHGIFKRMVIEANDEAEIFDKADQESLNLIKDKLHNELYSEAVAEYEFEYGIHIDDSESSTLDDDNDKILDIYNSLCEEDIDYILWQIDEYVASGYTTQDLNIKFDKEPDYFIEKFCKQY